MYHFWKPSTVSKSFAADSTSSLPTLDPLPPPRTDSLPGHKLDEVDRK